MRPSISSPKKIKLYVPDLFQSADNFTYQMLDDDPKRAMQTGKLLTKAWSQSIIGSADHLKQAHTFFYKVISSYWYSLEEVAQKTELRKIPDDVELTAIDRTVIGLAHAIGKAASKLPFADASYLLGNIYTSVLPENLRSSNGVFYTPPSLTRRLLDLIEQTGIDWSRVKVLDPACGGGAFLAPVALRMRESLKEWDAAQLLNHIETHLKGFDIDSFGSWFSQVFLDVVLKDITRSAGRQMVRVTEVCNSLEREITNEEKYDVVIGNPPYGKVTLTPELRKKYKRGLYGHANLYGLFTDLALRLVKQGGTIGYLTPTSFLSGEYFKNLRALIRKQCTPIEMDFVAFRKGVFEDVLQETMLTIYKNEVFDRLTKVNQIVPDDNNDLSIYPIEAVNLPKDNYEPWLLARSATQSKLVSVMHQMENRLADWGYKVSTGPLVWNRHKEQLKAKFEELSYPIIWSESITSDGNFVWKTEKKNHCPYIKLKNGDNWLITKKSCVLLQRTTSKEQGKRLIASVLPAEFINERGGVIVENHLNMIVPLNGSCRVDQKVLSIFLNSQVINDAFRCISGSVAVSAYELESLPLPTAGLLRTLATLIDSNVGQNEIEMECKRIYYSKSND